jgi:hypothetical protein
MSPRSATLQNAPGVTVSREDVVVDVVVDVGFFGGFGFFGAGFFVAVLAVARLAVVCGAERVVWVGFGAATTVAALVVAVAAGAVVLCARCRVGVGVGEAIDGVAELEGVPSVKVTEVAGRLSGSTLPMTPRATTPAATELMIQCLRRKCGFLTGSSIQKRHPGGAGGQLGSGFQSGDGSHPIGG